VGGEDAVVDDVLDVGIGLQGRDGSEFVGGIGGGVENRDAEGIVVADDAGTSDDGAGFDGDDVGAVDDEITVRNGGTDGAGKLLRVCAQAAGEEEGDESDGGENKETAQEGDQAQGAECVVGGDGVEWKEDGRPRRCGAGAWGNALVCASARIGMGMRARGRAETLPQCPVLGGV